jgi:hypothetical protein
MLGTLLSSTDKERKKTMSLFFQYAYAQNHSTELLSFPHSGINIVVLITK